MIDLHTHTNISDGTDTVKELLENANNINLEVLSITDHDTTDAYYDVIKLRDLFKGIIIPGVELKAYYDGMPLEVLGYGIDHTKININRNAVFDMQVDCLEEFKNIGRSLGLKFDENIQVSKTDSRRKYASFTFAEELLKHKENESILLSIGPMFSQTEFYRVHASNKKSMFYYDESKLGITIEKAIDMIHNAGGLAFLAHPLIYPYEKDKFEEVEYILKNYKLEDKIITKEDIDQLVIKKLGDSKELSFNFISFDNVPLLISLALLFKITFAFNVVLFVITALSYPITSLKIFVSEDIVYVSYISKFSIACTGAMKDIKRINEKAIKLISELILFIKNSPFLL